jgi:RNA polymerase sigma factor (sigma-70 family)
MRQHPMTVVLDHVRRLADPAVLTDGELLRLFASSRDKSAFEALMRRHGPLIYGLCRRSLGDGHIAEDVFQATFLVLARKAGSVRNPALLASWLYGVASRLAQNERRKARRRRRHEVSSSDLPSDGRPILDRVPEEPTMSTDPAATLGTAELLAALDEELARLPDKYRMPLLLCGVAGEKAAEAARNLGCSEAALKSRLRRGRELLRRRLARLGFGLSVAALATLLEAAPASPAVPATVLTATVRTALPFVTRQALSGSSEAVALAERLLRSLALQKFAFGLVVAVSLVLFGGAATLPAWRDTDKRPTKDTQPGGVYKAAKVDRHGDPLPPGALARLGTIRWRHGAIASFVTYTPDGKQLVSAGADGVARLWDATTGQELRRTPLTPHRTVASVPVAVSADGRTLASCVGLESVRVWDLTTGKETRPLKEPPESAFLLALDGMGRRLAVYGHDGSLGLWDLESGRRLRRLREPQEGIGEFVPGSDGTLVFSPDGKELASSRFETIKDDSPRSVIRIWDTTTGKERLKITGVNELNGAFAPAYSPDGQMLGWAGLDGAVRLVEPATGKELRKLRAGPGAVRFAFSADGKVVVTRADISREVTVWERETGRELRTLKPPAGAADTLNWGFGGVVQHLALSPDGSRLALAGEGCAISLLDLDTGKVANVSGGHRATVSGLTYLPGGQEIASRGNDGAIRVWEATTGKKIGQVEVPPKAMTYVLSPDGKSLATTGPDNVLRLWDAGSGKETHQFAGSENGLVHFEFSPDGRTLAVTDPGSWSLRLYDVASGKKTLTLSLNGAEEPSPDGVHWAGSSPALFSPNGRLVASCVPALAIVVWDASTGREVLRVPVAREGWPHVTSAYFSPDARTLALERDDGSVSLWEIATGKERARLKDGATGKASDKPAAGGGPGPKAIFPVAFLPGVESLAYSPDGRFLARVTGHAASLWDVVARKELGQFSGHVGDIAVLAYAPDGKTLATGSTDGTGLVWDVTRLTEPATRSAAEVKSDALTAAWAALAAEDAARAFDGMTTLATAPAQAVPLLRERLQPAAAPDAKELADRVTQLDGEEFAVRENAAKALLQMGPTAGPALRKALDAKPSAEVKRQIEALLTELDQTKVSKDSLRPLRAVEVLEMIRTPEARELLKTLAGGAPGAPVTEAAREARQRLGK